MDGFPTEEHSMWYSYYKYDLLLKHQSYTETNTCERNLEAGTHSEHIGGVGSAINPLESIAVQSCLEMDFPEDKVKHAIVIYYQRNGDVNFKAKDLCEILFEIEENQDTGVQGVIATSAEVTSSGNEEFLVLFGSLVTKNKKCKMFMNKQEHLMFLAYHHLVSCQQCAQEFLTSQAICK